MKKMKKLAAVLMSLVMTAMLSIPALAAGEYSITINNDKAGHTYEAYQIFAGDVDSDASTDGTTTGPILSNIAWGSGVNSAELLAALKTADNAKYGACETAADVAEALVGEDGVATAADAAAFAEIASGYLTTAAGSANTPVGGKYTISGLDAGYYLVKDQDKSLDDDEDSYTSYIVQVLGNVEMAPKSDMPSSEKKVKDINDSTDADYGDWADTADHDIGDRIPFQLSATLPNNYAEYETYALTFHDTESTGLSFQQDTVKVYIDGKLVNTGDYQIVTTGLTDGYTFEIRFADLKTVTAADDTVADNSSVVTVEYESILNDQAVIGAQGNPNNMHITFSNNPNGEGTGRTPVDTVIVFTYKVVVDKVDGEGEELPGAEFTLNKKNAEGTWELVEIIGTGTETTFTFEGLDDGEYQLVESKTPASYNTIDPIEFTVTATHDDATLTLTALSGDVTSGAVELAFTPSIPDGSLSATVINNQGSTLPETGGIGTTIFFVLGGLLVIGAGVLLVVRVRVRAVNKD